MARRSKNYRKSSDKIENKEYTLNDAVSILKEIKASKFDESVDLAMRLGVDPKYPEQMVRGTLILTHGIGKIKKVLVIANTDKQTEGEEAGADFTGGEEIVEKITKENWVDYDVVVATPDMMRFVGKLGKILGPKGLMPSPKAGTVTMNVKDTVTEIKKGRIEFRVDKTGIINSSIGKISFDAAKLVDNARDFIKAVMKAKPPALKGEYIKSVYLSSTMSPSIKLNFRELD